ncbi:hypothetical protein [Hydrogenophaga sp. RWCD_12]|uniref:hypothetical protein n=1 Tax=Hydrogenophaga sp. RWCD_12 TaxID=3391190 RepID=UPI0039849D17
MCLSRGAHQPKGQLRSGRCAQTPRRSCMNPEFKRNLWLEISPARLFTMPLVLTLIGLLVVSLNLDDPHGSLFMAFAVLFIGLTVGWGSLLVVSSINNEVSERTWDQQRLSALTPWQMAWGKLFGSAAYAWYGGLLCALVAVVAALAGPAFWSRSVWLLVGAVGAVALHAWLMASRLHTLDIRSEKASGMASRLFGLFLALQTLPMIFMVLRDPASPDIGAVGNWWGLGLPLSIQSLLVALLLLALGLLALWRSMGKQLMVRAVPWAWVTGVAGMGWVLAGFLPQSAWGSTLWMTMAGVALASTYVALFTEANTRLVWQAVLYHRAHSPARRLWQALPLWPLSWGLTALFLLAFTLAGGTSGGRSDPPPLELGSLMWLALLHTLRDCGIYHFFAFRHTIRKPAAMTLLTLFVLGVVLPGLAIGAAPALTPWIEPFFGINELIEGKASLGMNVWLAMWSHLLLIAGLVGWRWSVGAPVVQGAQASDPNATS